MMFSLFRRAKASGAAHGEKGRVQPVFIVGQYKCGSTWLLSILSAHPQVIGVDEINLLDAAGLRADAPSADIAPEERLAGFFERNAWANFHEGGKLCHVASKLAAGEPIPAIPWDRAEYQKIVNLPQGRSGELYGRIKAATTPEQAMDAFLEVIGQGAEGETHLVLKASNQVPQMEQLRKWKPDAKKLVIIRDGRDAALSGYHYEKRMKENNPFGWGGNDFWSLLKYWCEQVRLAEKWALQGELYIVRYEDLWHDFIPTVRAVLQWLGLDDAKGLIKAIDRKTCFEVKTGRKRGVEEPKSFRRKGMAGEWVEALSPEDKEKAWELAGAELSRFGYTRDATVEPLASDLRIDTTRR